MAGVTSSPQILSPFLPQSSNSPAKPTTATFSAFPKPNTHLALTFAGHPRRGTSLRCSSSSTDDSTSGENESKSVLDAFFLGKALAEVLNERLESAVGEIMSTVGKLQSEQQKHIEGFQEDVVTRAKKAKQEAAGTTSVVAQESTDYADAEIVASEVDVTSD